MAVAVLVAPAASSPLSPRSSKSRIADHRLFNPLITGGCDTHLDHVDLRTCTDTRSIPGSCPPGARFHTVVVDRHGRAPAAPPPTCLGGPATIVGHGAIHGTAHADVIVGSQGADMIIGGGGNDRICVAGGDATTEAGDESERVAAGR